MDLAARIREHRTAAGISQEDAAADAGVAQATWSRWESGTHSPRTAHLGAIARALDCQVADLVS